MKFVQLGKGGFGNFYEVVVRYVEYFQTRHVGKRDLKKETLTLVYIFNADEF